MESIVRSGLTRTSTGRITDALATLQRELICLREQDGKLMTQLMGMNDTIQTLSKQRPTSVRLTRKTLSKGNGRRRFINTNPSIPEETFTELPASVPAISHKSERLSGSLSSLEDMSCSTEEQSSSDSDSDDSLCSGEHNL